MPRKTLYMKTIIHILLTLFVAFCYSQEKDHLTNSAIRNDSLIIGTSNGVRGDCQFLEQPVYYINKNYVIYQDCNTRKIVYPHNETFKEIRFRRGIAIDKNGVYVKGNFIATDTTGFTLLGNDKEGATLWKNKTNIYKDTTILTNLNVKNFTPLTSHNKDNYSNIYFKDSANVYYFDKIIETADPITAYLGDGSNQEFYDKNHIYKNGEIVTFEGEPLTYINLYFQKTTVTKKVIAQNKVIPNIDVETLVGLSRYYAKDKNNVYFYAHHNGIHILPIDKADFDNIKVWDHTNSSYISDGKKVFAGYSIKDEFDASTFGTFGFTDYVYDKNGVYTRRYDKALGKVIYDKFPFKYTDAVSSKNLQITERSDLYFYYKNQAYDYRTKILYENLTPEQIKLSKKGARLTKLNGKVKVKGSFDYKLDKIDNAIYYDDKKTSADATTFKKLGYGGYFIDKNNVYKYDREKGLQIINLIDAKTAKTLNELIADKNNLYGYNQEKNLQAIPLIDVKTAENFNGFIKDKNYLFIGNTQIIKSEELEILAAYPGYRKGCGLDETPTSNYYLFKNIEGFWWVQIGSNVTVRFLGKTLRKELSPLFKNLEMAEI